MSDKRADPSVLEAMLNKAQNKLKAAGSAFENEFFDDAASCSYYAAYHAVCALLASRGLAFSSHGQTLGAFNREFVKTGRLPAHAFRKIQKLFEDRNIGDYDPSAMVDSETAKRDVADAEWIVEEIRLLLKEHLKPPDADC